MTTAKYYIATKPLSYNSIYDIDVQFVQHLYLIKDNNGDLSNISDQTIIRGGPDIEISGNFGNIEVEAGEALADSKDFYSESGYTIAQYTIDRNLTELSLSDSEWDDMISYVKGMGTQDNGEVYDTDYYYGVNIKNSNSVITSALNSVGYDLIDYMPYIDGDTGGSKFDFNTLLGTKYILGTTGNDTLNIHDSIKYVDGGGGADTFTISGNDADSVDIIDTDNNDTIIFSDISSTDTVETYSEVNDLTGVETGYAVFTASTGEKRYVSLFDIFDGSGGVKSGASNISVEFNDSNTSNWNTIFTDSQNNSTYTSINRNNRIHNTRESVQSAINDVEVDFGQIQSYASPLVLDLDGDGVELTSLSTSGVYWDIDQDGFAEASGWVAADDGLLAIDLNGDGVINDNGELFGTETTDGFTILSNYDSNSDGVINSSDAQFGDLLVWKDTNQDAYSQSSELSSLSAYNITSIDLNATTVSYTLNGAHITHESTYEISGSTTRDIYDAWFEYDNTNTKYNLDYIWDVRTLDLPSFRGYGNIADLEIAMSLDEELLFDVDTFVDQSFLDYFTDPAIIYNDVESILFQWADVDGIATDSRGQYLSDARMLAFQEKLFGTEFLQRNRTDPGPEAAYDLEANFRKLVNRYTSLLMLDSAAGDLFDGTSISYDIETDTVSGVTGLNQTRITDLENNATNASDVVEYWKGVVGVISSVFSISSLSTSDYDALDNAIQNTSSETLTSIEDAVGDGLSIVADLDGSIISGSGTIFGTNAINNIYGGSGDDTIYANDGLDIVYGGGGDDILYGQNGSDTLYGEEGNDTYVYDDGYDVVVDEAGTDDTIVFDAAFNTVNFTFERFLDDLDIKYNGDLVVTVQDQFKSNDDFHIESFDFDYDSSSLTLSQLTFDTYGTSLDDDIRAASDLPDYDDTIYAYEGDDTVYSGGGADTIYGAEGNDTLRGEDGNDFLRGTNGNDTLYGEDGNDTLIGDGGNDRLFGGAGDDTLSGTIGDNIFDGGAGNDWLRYDTGAYTLTAGITLDLGAGLTTKSDGSEDLLVDIERVNATSYADTLTASDSGEDRLYGLGGNDTLYGGTGRDWLYGGDGDDYIDGKGGLDIIYGGNGNDTIYGGADDDDMFGQAGNDTLYGLDGNDDFIGSTGNDTFYGGAGVNIAKYTTMAGEITVDMSLSSNQVTKHDSSVDDLHDIERVYGSNYNDTMTGGSQVTNILFQGFDGDDTLTGWNGADYLYGQNGNDTLDGKGYNDRLYGGAGDDLFIYESTSTTTTGGSGYDTIVDDDSSGDTDTLRITGGIDHDNLWFEQVGNDLVITINGTSQQIELEGWYGAGGGQIEAIETANDSMTLSAADFDDFVTQMSTLTKSTSGNQDYNSTAQTALTDELMLWSSI